MKVTLKDISGGTYQHVDVEVELVEKSGVLRLRHPETGTITAYSLRNLIWYQISDDKRYSRKD